MKIEELKKQLKDYDENSLNDDHKSREKVRWTKAEDDFIQKCYNIRIPKKSKIGYKRVHIKEWNKKKGLKGRSLKGVQKRFVNLVKANLEMTYAETKVNPSVDLKSRRNKIWTHEEITEINKQRLQKKLYREIIIPGRSEDSVSKRLRIQMKQKYLPHKPRKKDGVKRIDLDNPAKVTSFFNSLN